MTSSSTGAPAGTTDTERRAIGVLSERLAERFSDRHDPDHVRQTIEASYGEFAAAKVRAFVPILVERMAAKRLESPAPP